MHGSTVAVVNGHSKHRNISYEEYSSPLFQCCEEDRVLACDGKWHECSIPYSRTMSKCRKVVSTLENYLFTFY